jgi:hypothetical protein
LDVLRDTLFFTRNVRLKHFFRNADDVRDVNPFREPSGWTPPSGMNLHLERFIGNIIHDATNHHNPGNPPNLKPHHIVALNSLKNNPTIIIKPADKGGAIVIWGRDQYVQEALRQLSNPLHYRVTGTDSTQKLCKTINGYLSRCYDAHMIDVVTLRHLITREPRVPCFYMLPKVHKIGNPGRPIVSACGGPTDKISGFVDHYIKQWVPFIPSYLKDTTDFLNKVRHLQIPPGSLLASVDVSALYTNIPHMEGIQAVRDCLLQHATVGTTPTAMILRLLHYVLTCNHFEFDGQHYHQVLGCAMGTKCAPNYANIFMGALEARLLLGAPLQPLVWWRFIDDVFMIWTHGMAAFEAFLAYLNQAHATIKFTHEVSPISLNFLDVTVYVDDHGQLQTKLYTKPTDAHLYLYPASSHPPSTKKAIPYSQALRIRKICSTLQDLLEGMTILRTYFQRRGYSKALIENAISKASAIDRDTLLVPRVKTASDRTLAIYTYGDRNFHPRKAIKQHEHILLAHPDLRDIVEDGFMIAQRQTANLRNILVRSRFMSNPPPKLPWGSYKCGKNCVHCPFMEETTHYRSTTTSKLYKIKGHHTCNSTNVVYLITCERCGLQYVGETGQQLKARFAGHRSDIRREDEYKPVSRHFSSPTHDTNDVHVIAIERNNSWNNVTRRIAEATLIMELQTQQPSGLNIKEN